MANRIGINCDSDLVIRYPNFNKTLGAITTRGGSYTATENCWVYGLIQPSSDGSNGFLYFDGRSVAGSAGAANTDVNTVLIPAPKGTVISSRSDGGIYTLTIVGCL